MLRAVRPSVSSPSTEISAAATRPLSFRANPAVSDSSEQVCADLGRLPKIDQDLDEEWNNPIVGATLEVHHDTQLPAERCETRGS